MNSESLPVIVGVGQVVDRWTGTDAGAAPHPVAIVRSAIDAAITDAGGSGVDQAIDCAAFVRTFPDSLPRRFDPFGRIENFPHAVLKDTLHPEHVIYSAIGGEQPQALVNEVAARLSNGDIEVALIAGGEVTGALKTALKAQISLDWSDHTAGDLEDRDGDDRLLSKYEIHNGLGMPPQTYAAQEQAWRARHGLSTGEYHELVGEVFARLSEVAATNPCAQFPTALDAEFLATPSKENYPICDPLLKWHVAQDAVNQSAALVLTTVGTARDLGIAEEKWVYLHGHADVKDTLVSKRPDLSRSDAIELALTQALTTSGVSADGVAHLDLYSCFPIVPMLAAEYLGIDPTTTTLTVTGGLPFFGGPGNNYSTHAIASMVDVLRDDRDAFGLVLANGGFISKESAGVYSTRAPEQWEPRSSSANQTSIDNRPDIALLEEDCEALIEAYCIKRGRDGADAAYVIARSPGGRVIANIDKEHLADATTFTSADDLVGRTVRIERRERANFVVDPHLLGAP